MPIVALIGPDGAGKTTIANILRRKFDYDFYKGTHEGPEVISDVFTRAVSRARQDRVLLCDRLHYPDDIVYSKVIHNVPSTLESISSLCENILLGYDTILILVTANPAVLCKRLAVRGDDYISTPSVSLVSTLLRLYLEFLADTDLPWYAIDTVKLRPSTSAHIVEKIIYGHWPKIYEKSVRRSLCD